MGNQYRYRRSERSPLLLNNAATSGSSKAFIILGKISVVAFRFICHATPKSMIGKCPRPGYALPLGTLSLSNFAPMPAIRA